MITPNVCYDCFSFHFTCCNKGCNPNASVGFQKRLCLLIVYLCCHLPICFLQRYFTCHKKNHKNNYTCMLPPVHLFLQRYFTWHENEKKLVTPSVNPFFITLFDLQQKGKKKRLYLYVNLLMTVLNSCVFERKF